MEKEGKQIRQGMHLLFVEELNSLTPHFVDGKDDLNSYLLQLEMYAIVANCLQADLEAQLSVLLVGKALNIFQNLGQKHFILRTSKGGATATVQLHRTGTPPTFRRGQPRRF